MFNMARSKPRIPSRFPAPAAKPVGCAKTTRMGGRFAKYEGLGNDFVIVSEDAAGSMSARDAATICDRHRGVGADGVLIVSRERMRVINADGSRPEMCGNGLRCVALHLVRTGVMPVEREFSVDTDAGPHTCFVAKNARESDVRIGMRPAALAPNDVPVIADRIVLDQPFEVPGAQYEPVRLSCVSMGNPHAVTFDDIAASARAVLGPLLEKHARFPRAANIGFARVLGPSQIELAVWERGVGFTEACGTGACACAVAAVETGRAQRHTPIAVALPGGVLTITVGAGDERIIMSGAARHVFDGQL
jgi:diaminopimelate epimerase